MQITAAREPDKVGDVDLVILSCARVALVPFVKVEVKSRDFTVTFL